MKFAMTAGCDARHINVLIHTMHSAPTINNRILGEDKLHFPVSLHLSLFIYIFVPSFCSVNFIDIVQQTHQLMKTEKIAFSLSLLFFCLLLSFNCSSLQLIYGQQQLQSSIKLLHKSMLNCCHLSSHLKSI